jgi:hypothetical protein
MRLNKRFKNRKEIKYVNERSWHAYILFVIACIMHVDVALSIRWGSDTFSFVIKDSRTEKKSSM